METEIALTAEEAQRIHDENGHYENVEASGGVPTRDWSHCIAGRCRRNRKMMRWVRSRYSEPGAASCPTCHRDY